MTLRVRVTHASPGNPANLVVELIDLFVGVPTLEVVLGPGQTREFSVWAGQGVSVTEYHGTGSNPEMADNTAPD